MDEFDELDSFEVREAADRCSDTGSGVDVWFVCHGEMIVGYSAAGAVAQEDQ